MSGLQSLPNIGPELEKHLIKAGIETPEKLRETGARDAFIRIRADDPTACLHMLLALEGAVRGVKKAQLPDDVKAGTKAFFKSLG